MGLNEKSQIENAETETGTNRNLTVHDTPTTFSFVITGNIKQLKIALINKYDPSIQDANGRTVLHHAVAYGNGIQAYRMMKLILNSEHKSKDFLDIQDNKGETALHLASKLGRQRIVEKLLVEDAMMTLRDKEKNTALTYIYKNIPDVILKEYDECVTFKKEGNKYNEEELALDFDPVIGYMEDCNDDIDLLKEADMLGYLLRVQPARVATVLDHPLVQAFLYLKYSKAYLVLMASIAIHIFWYAIYAAFIFILYFEVCPWKRNTENETLFNRDSMKVNCTAEDFKSPGLPLAVASWILAVLFLTKEIFEMFAVPPSRYFSQMENIGQLVVIGSVIWTPWPIYEYLAGKDIVVIKPWQYELAAISVFVVWTLILCQLGNIQELRIYLEIFVKVVKSFVVFVFLFMSMLLAFAFSFCIIMPEAKAFKTPLLAIPKLLVMMTGELNYDEVFYNEDDPNKRPFHFTATQLIYVLFTIIMSIILFNLLIGLTVSDTQELKNKGRIAQLSSMLEAIYLAESVGITFYKLTKNTWLLDILSIDEAKVTNNVSCFSRKKSSSAIEMTETGIDIAEKASQASSESDDEVVIFLSLSGKSKLPKNVMDSLRKLAEKNLYEENEDEKDNENEDLSNEELLRKILEELPKQIYNILNVSKE